jgi:hypothetical protein
MTVKDDQDQQELVRELLQLQIRQTEILEQLVIPQGSPQADTANSGSETTERPFRIGDRVRVKNPTIISGSRIHRDTVCTVVKVGRRITSLAPNGHKIVRAPHNLERV